MALTCPECAVTMNEVKAEAKIGYLIQLDQCPRCGGIWCDRWEVFPLTVAAVEGLDTVDANALRTPTGPVPEVLRCPRCRARMAVFRDPALPQFACIQRCLNCEGMWFNRGELRRFKAGSTHASATAAGLKDAEIDRVVGAIGDRRTWSTVHNLDTAMSAPPPEDSPETVRRELASGAAWMVARALVRLLLHI